MNFNDILKDYINQAERASKEWNEYYTTVTYQVKGYDGFKGFKINYANIDETIIGALMTEFGFTKQEAGFIQGQAYADKHSYYGNVIPEAERLANFIREFQKLSK
jgi:hypothetical protein